MFLATIRSTPAPHTPRSGDPPNGSIRHGPIVHLLQRTPVCPKPHWCCWASSLSHAVSMFSCSVLVSAGLALSSIVLSSTLFFKSRTLYSSDMVFLPFFRCSCGTSAWGRFPRVWRIGHGTLPCLRAYFPAPFPEYPGSGQKQSLFWPRKQAHLLPRISRPLFCRPARRPALRRF